MPLIKFQEINTENIDLLQKMFEYIKKGKQKGSIRARKMKRLLGERYKTKFLWSNKKTATKSTIDTKLWDFGSWIIALMNADIELKSLEVDSEGKGSLEFEQLAWPSGGVDALEELIRIYDGIVISNNAL